MQELSGGWRMRVALARLMLSAPDLLVLDEPTNHLDVESVAWLEQHLAQWPGAILFVSHDRDFLDAVAQRVVEVAHGRAIEYVGGFEEFVIQREERLAAAEAAAAAQQRQLASTERFIERFRYKATKARQVQSRVKALEKLDRLQPPPRAELVAKFAFPEPQRSVPGRGRGDRRLGRLRRYAGAVATSTWSSSAARSWRWSARTAPARRRCCGCCSVSSRP